MKIIRKIAKKITAIASAIFTTIVINTAVFAEDAGAGGNGAMGGAPAEVDTTALNGLVTIVMWVVRIIIIAFGIPCIVKIVQGQSNEDPRERNNGIIGCIVVGAVFGASFAIQALLA